MQQEFAQNAVKGLVAVSILMIVVIATAVLVAITLLVYKRKEIIRTVMDKELSK